MNKNFVVDTNVLIDDPKSLVVLRNDVNEVSIPLEVILELDKLKTDSKVGSQAREAIRFIYSNRDWINLISDFASEDMLSESFDGKILTNIVTNYKNGILVSNDMIMRFLAEKIYGYPCEEYKESVPYHTIGAFVKPKTNIMKKLVISLLLISSLAFSTLSQTVIKPGIGMNFTSLSGDPLSYNSTGRLGWQIGGTLAIGSEFYLEPGIFWMKNNWDLQEISNVTDTKFKNDISSLRIPVYVGWNVVGSGSDDRNFHIFGGPSAMIVTKVNTQTTGLTKDDFADYIWGMNVGAGLSISKIFIDAGYEWGLTNMYKDDPNEAKSRGFWLNAGFRLKFM